MAPNHRTRLRIIGRLTTTSALLFTALFASLQDSSGVRAAAFTQNFGCTQSPEYFTVPTDVYDLTFDMYGASDGWQVSYGARVTGTVAVTPGESLAINVGCKGVVSDGSGGYPNGGHGGGIQGQNAASGGGGSSSIVAESNGNYEIVAIAGGAGGSTNFTIGGAAGMNGDDAPPGWTDMRFMDGKGATQSAAGAETCNLANFCYGAGAYLQGGESPYGGGGGGGYYGGGAGTGDLNYWWGNSYSDYSTAGGGGSSYVSPARSNGFSSPQYYTGWSDGAGSIALSWTPTPTTTIASTTTAVSTTTLPSTTTTTTTTTTLPSTTTTPTASTTLATTTTLPPTTTTTVALAAPSWSSFPEVESELPVSASTPFPHSGAGTVEVTNETGFVVTKSRSFIPKWRTRVYIGDFKFSLKASYNVNKKKKTFTCSIPTFGTQKIQKTSSTWRWYQPSKGCVLPKDLVSQLSKRQTTMTLTGTFTRKWATTGKTKRPDGSKISTRKISLRIGATETVTLS